MPSAFDQLASTLDEFRNLARQTGCEGFLGQEALRFYSIAGTLRAVSGFAMDETAGLDERYITHPLARSLLENFFCVLYIFDQPNLSPSRYDRILNGFKIDYDKLMREVVLPKKSQLESADATWRSLQHPLNVHDMILQVRNNQGQSLSYLYFVYRITSFDVHGKSLSNLYEAAFGKNGNFPVLKINKVIEIISSEYLATLNQIKQTNISS